MEWYGFSFIHEIVQYVTFFKTTDPNKWYDTKNDSEDSVKSYTSNRYAYVHNSLESLRFSLTPTWCCTCETKWNLKKSRCFFES